MKRNLVLIASGIMLLTVVGCESQSRPQVISTYDKVPFTNSLRAENELTAPEIQRLQFYVSHQIVLQNRASSGKREVSKGKLITKEGQAVDEVVVNKGTPGIAVKVEDRAIRISFEEKTSIGFAAGQNPDPDNYSLAIVRNEKGENAVRYAGADYAAMDNSALSYLLIKKEDLSELVNKRRVLPGRRIRE